MLLPDRRLSLSTGAFAALYVLLAMPAVWGHTPSGPWLVASVVLAVTLAALSAIDVREHRLPDALTLPLAAAGLLVSTYIVGNPLWWHVTSAVIGFALMAGVAAAYRHVRGRDGLGLGDAKLFAVSGAWLGLEALPTVLLCACASAMVAVLIANRRWRDISSTTRIPFGPFLGLGTWIMWLYGPL
jgi:leader peptidase (prepilin peptidase)/N-methyltransferase